MKKLDHPLLRMGAIILPVLFLCSCYEIVYVSQDTDTHPKDFFKPVICIQVYETDNTAVTPYFGIVTPEFWDVKTMVITFENDGDEQIIGKLVYNTKLSHMMQIQKPPDKGYTWWVGTGSSQISQKGVYRVYPLIRVGSKSGNYQVKYMLGDSHNGLNVVSSEKITVHVVQDKSAANLIAASDGKVITLQWSAPKETAHLGGYHVYRDGTLVSGLVKEPEYSESGLPPGSYSYTVQPVYKGLEYGLPSTPVNLCHTPCGTSMEFDGIDDKLLVFDDPTLQLSHDITLEAWIKRGYEDAKSPRIISKGKKLNGYELLLSQYKNDKVLQFSLPFAYVRSQTPLLPEVWYHVAAVYDGASMKLYINGKPDCIKEVHGKMVNSDYPLAIGKSSTANMNYFKGDIDNVRIWNVARTGKEIFDNFSSRVPPDAEGLVGSWNMSEGCSTMTCDNSNGNHAAYLSGSCWCAELYPYVESINYENVTDLIVPVMNYRKAGTMESPKMMTLEFRVNPTLLKFEKVITTGTQLAGYIINAKQNDDGTIVVKALNHSASPGLGDVLLYLDLMPLMPKFNTPVRFNLCEANGTAMRVESGTIIVEPHPGEFKATTTGSAAVDDPFVRIYPNPATSCLTVETDGAQTASELRVLNMSGEVLYSRSLPAGSAQTVQKIDLKEFSKGIYLISLQLNGVEHVKKFVVN